MERVTIDVINYLHYWAAEFLTCVVLVEAVKQTTSFYIFVSILWNFSNICEELILSFFQVRGLNFPNYFSHEQVTCKSHPILNFCICGCQILVSVLLLLSTVTSGLET